MFMQIYPQILKKNQNYFRKIVRGLYYFEYAEALPVSTIIDTVMANNTKTTEEFNKNVTLGKRSWPGIFEYKLNRLPDNHEGSMWLFLIYDTLLFGSVTYQEGYIPKIRMKKTN